MLSKMPSAVRCLRRFLLSGLTNFSLSSTSGWHAKWSKCTRWAIMASTGCSASKADWSRHTGVHPFEGYWPTSVCHQQVAGMQNDQNAQGGQSWQPRAAQRQRLADRVMVLLGLIFLRVCPSRVCPSVGCSFDRPGLILSGMFFWGTIYND